MITEIQGHGKQKGLVQQWRGKEYKVSLLPKVKIEVVIKDQDIERTIRAIKEAAYTGEMGDGKIFISNIEDAVRIRTDERGNSAIQPRILVIGLLRNTPFSSFPRKRESSADRQRWKKLLDYPVKPDNDKLQAFRNSPVIQNLQG